MKVCTTCGVAKSETEFHTRKASKDGLMSSCKVCKAAYHRQYNSTVHGQAVRFWNNINTRANNRSGKDPSYANIGVEMSRAEFLAWCEPALERWRYEYPYDRPSIDRIDPDGPYKLGNIRMISLSANSKLARYKNARRLRAERGGIWYPSRSSPPAFVPGIYS